MVNLPLRAYPSRTRCDTQFTISWIKYGHFFTMYCLSLSSVSGFNGVRCRWACNKARALMEYVKQSGRSRFFSPKLVNCLISCKHQMQGITKSNITSLPQRVKTTNHFSKTLQLLLIFISKMNQSIICHLQFCITVFHLYTRGDPKISRIVTKNLFKIFIQV